VSHDYTYRHSEHSVYNLSDDAPKDAEHPEGGAHHQAAYRQPDVLRHLSEICRCCHIFAVFDFFVFYADSRAEGVEFQTILSASRLSDIFFMRLSVASVVFVSGA
jgi:hypothetical protein